MNSPKPKLKIALILIGVTVLVIFVGAFILKPLYNLNVANRGTELGFNASYKQVSRHCPTNVELQLTCLRRFYTEESTQNIQNTLQNSLKNAGYEIKVLAKGYDGPNQKAYAAYSSRRNVSTTVIIVETNNTAYKKAMGNVRVESSIGKNDYSSHD